MVTKTQRQLVNALQAASESKECTFTFAIHQVRMECDHYTKIQSIEVIQVDVDSASGFIQEIRCYSKAAKEGLSPQKTFTYGAIAKKLAHQLPQVDLKGTIDVPVPGGLSFVLHLQDGKKTKKLAKTPKLEWDDLLKHTLQSVAYPRTLENQIQLKLQMGRQNIDLDLLNNEKYKGARPECSLDKPKRKILPPPASMIEHIPKGGSRFKFDSSKRGGLPAPQGQWQTGGSDHEELEQKTQVPEGPSSSGSVTPDMPIPPKSSEVDREERRRQHQVQGTLIFNAPPVMEETTVDAPKILSEAIPAFFGLPSPVGVDDFSDPDQPKPKVLENGMIINAQPVEDSSSEAESDSSEMNHTTPDGVRVVGRRRCITQQDQISENMAMLLALIPLIVILMFLFKRFYTPTETVGERLPRDHDEHQDANFCSIV